MFYIVTEICQHIVTVVTVRQKKPSIWMPMYIHLYMIGLCNSDGVCCEIWGTYSSVGEDYLLGCDTCDWARISWLFKDNSVLFFLDCLTLKVKALWSFKTLRNACPVTQHHIPVGLNLWTVLSLRYKLRLKE